ncbi:MULTISPECIES: PAS domain S-box protein [Halolamina]|uniref:histidine kinase n=1 Tax=Halolamina pelagica TaxID=699431 RepID=A0A1I5NUI3_9EURY|nr:MULTISPECIES: PAS domain S-box protein [Halolamina]NHX36485.1 PAS domain S-box protein [Halolamina sp. R1-12]SFP25468.1 PAS domain S-box-containing protein [Halolamina pelagica]
MQTSPDTVRALHVDPDSSFVDAAATRLEREDDRLDVTTTTDADEALALLENDAFDCVIADYDLPETTGIELFQSVRDRDSELPFLLFTGAGSEAIASDALSAGVTDYLRKGRVDDQYAELADRTLDAVRSARRDSEPGGACSDGTPGFLQHVVEAVGVGVAAYRADGTFAYVNETFASNLDADRNTFDDVHVWEIAPELDREDFDRYWASFSVGDTKTTETTHAFRGTEVAVETVTTCTVVDGTTYHVGTARDITERKEREERFQAFVEQSNDILTVLDGNGVYKYQSPSAKRILGYEPGELVGESAFERVHPDDRADVVTTFQQVMSNPGQDLSVEYRFRHADGSWRWLESRGVNAPETSAIDGFLINSRDVTERKEHERQIGDLHDATRQMVQASDERDVCAVAVETAEEVLGHSIAGVWLRDETGDRLEPAATTAGAEERFDELPVYTEGNSLSWEAYETGEARVVDDLATESGLYNPDSEVRSEIIVPLGEYGVLNVGSPVDDAFTDNEVTLAKLLAANAQVALGRSERERLLERQTEQMEFFNSILRHDVLNAVTVIRARAEFLADELDGEQLQDAETIVRWSDDVTEIVQRVRTVVETLAGEGDPELEPVDLAAELRAEVDRVRSTYPEVDFETGIPEAQPVLANDLLGDALGNIVTNAIEHNDTDGLRVSVSVERNDGDVVVRIADNGTGVPPERKDAIFRRGETGHAKSTGSGFGLFFADAMVEEYGGDIRVEDNDAGGATFEVRLSAVDHGPSP